MPSLRQLEYLVTVAELASFTQAAACLHVSQPGLSSQVAALERELGTKLLLRLPSGVTVTPTGATAVRHAREALVAAGRVAQVGRSADPDVETKVRVATVYSVSIGVLPAVVRAWRERFPSVDIDVSEYRHSDALQDAMGAGRADLAVGPRPAGWSGPVRSLTREHFVVLLSERSPRKGQTIDLGELRDERWIHFAAANGLADVLDRACHAAGFTPRTAVRTEQTASAVALAEAGLGPALVPANVVPATFAGQVMRPSPAIERELVIYAHAAPDTLVAAMTGIDVPGMTDQATGAEQCP